MTMLFGGDQDGMDLRMSRRRRASWAAFGLAYMVPLIKVVSGYSGVRLGLAVLGLTAFVVLYMAAPLSMMSWISPVHARTYVLLGLLAVVCAGLPFAFGQEWVGMPVYLSTACAMTLPMPRVPGGVGAATALAATQCWLIDGARGAIGPLTLTTLSLGLFMYALRHARMLVQQLCEARGEVARLAAADERLRIARDLHDLLGRSLSLIVLKSELARRVGERDGDRDVERALAEVRDIEAVARESLADVRAAISGYRRRGLAEELDGARTVLTAAGVEVVVRMSAEPLPDAVDGLFGWAVREGVTNVVRHARAGKVTITAGRDRDDAALEIVDDGRDAEEATAGPGNGLSGLSERAAAAGGTVDAGPRDGGGFRLAVRVPLPPVAAAPARVESPT